MRALGWGLAIAELVAYEGCSERKGHAERSPSPASSNASTPPSLHEGDVVFHTSQSAQSKAIQLATHSRFSHVGLIHIDHGRTLVYEAVGPVKLTALDVWIARGEGKHFVAMRLKDAEQKLNPENLRALQTVGASYRNRPYDFAFGWGDDRIYCSELVWKIYKQALGIELGSLQRLGDFDLTHPVVREKMHQRYGDHIPLNEPVISPGTIAASPLLEKVFEE